MSDMYQTWISVGHAKIRIGHATWRVLMHVCMYYYYYYFTYSREGHAWGVLYLFFPIQSDTLSCDSWFVFFMDHLCNYILCVNFNYFQLFAVKVFIQITNKNIRRKKKSVFLPYSYPDFQNQSCPVSVYVSMFVSILLSSTNMDTLIFKKCKNTTGLNMLKIDILSNLFYVIYMNTTLKDNEK